MQHNYFVYILTNYNKTVLYTRVTNDLQRRVFEHKSCLDSNSFTSKYKCYYLVCFEHFSDIGHVIEQEKRIKGWSRKKKEILINDFNPKWRFLNDEISDL
jgi:putative endonuclease